jgi:hypothetical protein
MIIEIEMQDKRTLIIKSEEAITYDDILSVMKALISALKPQQTKLQKGRTKKNKVVIVQTILKIIESGIFTKKEISEKSRISIPTLTDLISENIEISTAIALQKEKHKDGLQEKKRAYEREWKAKKRKI